MKKIIKILGILVVLVVGIIGVVWFLSGDAAGAAKAQLEAIRDGDLDAAYDMGTAAFKDATSADEFEEFVNSYDVLENYDKVNFNDRTVATEGTTLIGTITSKNGEEAEIEYQLVKEDGEWKVLSLYIRGAGAAAEESADPIAADTQTFGGDGYGFSIDYPADWVYELSGDNTVIFSGEEGTDSSYSTVNVQNVSGESVDELIADLRNQFADAELDSTLTQTKIYTHTQADGSKIKGKEFSIDYTYDGTDISQRQIVVPGVDEGILHAWAYTAPAEIYEDYESIAEDMLKSWDLETM